MIAAVPINPEVMPPPLDLINPWLLLIGLPAIALYIRWRPGLLAP
jgi:hypothetical protein